MSDGVALANLLHVLTGKRPNISSKNVNQIHVKLSNIKECLTVMKEMKDDDYDLALDNLCAMDFYKVSLC